MARFLRKLDNEIKKKDGYVVAVWLTEDVAKSKEYLPVAQRSLQFKATALTCYPTAKELPGGWGINSDAHLTVVVAGKRRRELRLSLGERNRRSRGHEGVRESLDKEVRMLAGICQPAHAGRSPSHFRGESKIDLPRSRCS